MQGAEIFSRISGMAVQPRRAAWQRLALGLILFAASPFALAAAGQVVFVTGQAFVQRDQQIPVTRGLAVEQGDTLITYQDGRVQLLMANGDRIAIRPNSRFRIDQFVAPEAEQAREGVSLRQLGKSFYSLLRGGFRTLTNAKGERNASNYRVRTPVATLGIRGTYYVVRYCNNDCYSGVEGTGRRQQRRGGLKGIPMYAALWFSDLAPRDTSQPLQLAQAGDEFAQSGNLLPNGLDVGVIHGAVELINDAGSTVVGAGQFTSIRSSGHKGVVTNSAPQSLQQDMEEAELDGDWAGLDEDGDGGDGEDPYSGRRSPEEEEDELDEQSIGETGEDTSFSNEGDLSNEPEQPILATDANGNVVDLGGGGSVPPPTPPAPTPAPLSFAHPGHAPHAPDSGKVTIGGSGLNAFSYDLPGQSGTDNFAYSRGTALNVNVGQDTSGDTSLRWGRWSGGEAQLSVNGGPPAALDLTSDSLHWIYANDAAVLPISGTYNYLLIGNTNPTDNQGNVGVLNSAAFSADFLNQTVDSSVNLTVGGQNWDASGTGGFGPGGTFSGDYDNVNASGCVPSGCTADGSFSGFFTGGDGSGPPPGAGMTYELNTTSGDQVQGSAAFGDPAPPVIGQ